MIRSDSRTRWSAERWPYGAPHAVSELNTPGFDVHPVITQDGLTIYWGSDRHDGGAARGSEVWRATRPSPYEPFGNLGRVDERYRPRVFTESSG